MTPLKTSSAKKSSSRRKSDVYLASGQRNANNVDGDADSQVSVGAADTVLMKHSTADAHVMLGTHYP